MIIAEIITRSEAKKRIKKGQSAFGIIDDWDSTLYFDLNDKKLCAAFMQRFPKQEAWLHFASSIKEIVPVEKMDIPNGKYLIRNEKLVQYKSVKRLYKDFAKSEEELEEREKLMEEQWNKISDEWNKTKEELSKL